jgi:hypothetical protein
VGEEELTVGHEAAQLEQHAFGLEPLTHGGGVEPGEEARRIAPRCGPLRQVVGGTAAWTVTVAHLPIHQADGGGQCHAKPDGGAIAPGGRRHRGNVAAAGAGVNARGMEALPGARGAV